MRKITRRAALKATAATFAAPFVWRLHAHAELRTLHRGVVIKQAGFRMQVDVRSRRAKEVCYAINMIEVRMRDDDRRELKVFLA